MDNVAASTLRPTLLVPTSQGIALHHLRFPAAERGFSSCLLATVRTPSFHFLVSNFIVIVGLFFFFFKQVGEPYEKQVASSAVVGSRWSPAG